MHIQKNKFDCCGCSACANKCPKNAITMEPDELGFLYPVVDESKCIHCGLCIKVCKFEKGHELHPLKSVYGARLKDEESLMKSQSGGAFWALANSVIQDNGVVYGAALVNDISVSHIRVSTLEEMERLRMSKYVQSDINGSYKKALGDLRAGLKVLFSGTPCQISGLYSFLGREYANLYTISLICHGVPSPQVWRDYMCYMVQKNGKKVEKFIFRDKSFGWHSHHETFVFHDGSKRSGSTFRELFYAHYILRESCHHCPYTSVKRISDVTISDFWGWEKFSAEFNDNKGVSLIMTSTEKGEQMFAAAEALLNYRKVPQESCIQPQLLHPAPRPASKDAFQQNYISKGFEYVIHHYGLVGWRKYRKRAGVLYVSLRTMVSKAIRRIMK